MKENIDQNNPGLPISHDMIVKIEIPTPGGDRMMPSIPILKLKHTNEPKSLVRLSTF